MVTVKLELQTSIEIIKLFIQNGRLITDEVTTQVVHIDQSLTMLQLKLSISTNQ